MLHPIALIALVLLVVNDHVLKVHASGVLSGKLSDVAILVVGPLLLQALYELLFDRPTNPCKPSAKIMLAACAATGVAFVLEKTFAPATAVYRVLWGALRWPLDAVIALAGGQTVPALGPVAAVTDPTDLLTLPALWLAWRVHQERTGHHAAKAIERLGCSH